MQHSALAILPLCALVAAIVPAPSSLDINNPSGSDPTSPPTSISFPTGAPNPFPSGIPTQPSQCDGQNPSSDCFSAMAGGYLWYDKDSGCDDSQKSALETAVWDATTLAMYSDNFPNNGEGTHGIASGIFYMGPDYATQQTRIAGNLKRAFQFKTSETKAYITVSCTDTKNLCGKMIDGKAVGGYAWTYSGWVAYYHYITVCPVFFQLDTLSSKMEEVEKDLASGSTKMASDMTWLRNTGQFFLHEMMHTRLVDGGIEPHIIDEYVVPIPPGEKPGTNDVKAYGPRLVHNLARRSLNQGGGVTRASTNADSYAILANAVWWWDTTGYFPGVPGKKNPSTAQDDFDDDNFPVPLYVDLGNSTDPSSADATNLFITDLEGFGNGPQPTATAAPSATTAAPVPPSATAKFASGTCCFHVDEWQDCNNDSKNLYANITMYDNAKNMIYETPQNYLANGGLGEPINSGNGATFQGPLPQAIYITGEHEHDYVQFTYGSVSWTSRTTSGPATCKNGGWNPRDGPICLGSASEPAENQMDCCFPC